MGNGSGTLTYIVGKSPEKYFKEDVWMQIEELFEKLFLDEQRAQALFLIFCKIDRDNSRTVDIDECFEFFGGPRTRFTERIFFKEDPNSGPRGHDFVNFVMICWNYCTLAYSGLARMLFEIFDVEFDKYLQRPDVETMYRMIYDCDDPDDRYISEYKFTADDCISKSEFIVQSAEKRHLIQPAINFQKKMRKKLGGVMFWSGVASNREKYFGGYDIHSETIEEAMKGIIASEDPNRRRRQEEADKLLQEQQRKLQAEAEKAERELRERESYLEQERIRQEMNAPDREMKMAWKAVEQARKEFDDTEYLIDDIWNRREAREHLFELVDHATEISRAYYEQKDARSMELIVGTPQDHEARYQDYIQTPEGLLHHRRVYLSHLFKIILDQFEAKRNKKNKNKKAFVDNRSEKELQIAQAYQEITIHMEELAKQSAELKGRLPNAVTAAIAVADDASIESQDRIVIKAKSFEEEMLLAKKVANKKDMAEAERLTHEEIYEWHRQQVLDEAEKNMSREKIERERDLIRKEFDIVTNCGSRITRWEFVRDKENDRMCFVNIDTLEIMHAKTAICEKCDAIFEQSELKCVKCDAPRSSNNMKLYRPLGFKDIRNE